jgi:hypothetical protein
MRLDDAPEDGRFHSLGARIWLAGAVPEDATPAQRDSILDFVRCFAEIVFQGGGHILHGAHPSLTPTLLAEADKYKSRGGKRDCLTLAVSKYWSKDPTNVPVHRWREVCVVHETPEAFGEHAREESLGILRRFIAERCDAFVAVAGLWRRGVPIEVNLATDRGLPCFLLGGLGGAAREYLRDNPHVLRLLRNGFDERTNAEFATREEVSSLVGELCKQLSRLPLVKGRVKGGPSFRILALDGGGVKGAFSAAALATLSAQLDEPIARRFDLIAGTSTGGILAIGLGLGLSPQEILDFYKRKGPEIFPVMRLEQRLRNCARWLLAPKYSQKKLLDELEKAFYPSCVAKTLSDSISRLVLPAFDANAGVCHTFRTPHHQLLQGDVNTSAAHAALATAAAPTYFPAAKVTNHVSTVPYFDGGVWANCPALAAIVEAVCYLQVPLDRIDLLSIGTTDEPFTLKRKHNAGIFSWMRKKELITLLMNAQVDGGVRHAKDLVGEARFLRINTNTVNGDYTLDDAREIENLAALGHRAASDVSVLQQVSSRFLNGIDVLDWRS